MASEETAAPSGGGEGGSHRLLVVVGEAVAGRELRDEIRRHLAGSDAELHVLSPAFATTRFRQVAGEVDEGIEAARARLETSLEELRGDGLEAQGSVGDSEPDRAIEDTLADFRADEILIVTHRDEEARWLEDEAFNRARRYFDQPVTHLVVEGEGADEHVVDVEEAPPGRHDRPQEEPSARSWNLPPMAPRDILGIVVAIVGTGVLIVLAASCGEGAGLEEGGTGTGFDACDIRLLIAGAMGLANIAHVVALLLFESVRYRGFWERLLAGLSLFGTPAAIVVSLLIG